jgi:hypothetical protein
MVRRRHPADNRINSPAVGLTPEDLARLFPVRCRVCNSRKNPDHPCDSRRCMSARWAAQAPAAR